MICAVCISGRSNVTVFNRSAHSLQVGAAQDDLSYYIVVFQDNYFINSMQTLQNTYNANDSHLKTFCNTKDSGILI